jgi:dipeptidyl aminopeptidase/acylaminoacyl peptidase
MPLMNPRTGLAGVMFCLAACWTSALQAQQRPLELADMFRIGRISDPALSPDGRWAAYTLTTAVLEANRTTSDVWIAPVGGGEPRRLTSSPAHDRTPRWSPDGTWILFESTRTGSNQIWAIHPDGTGERQVTAIATEASDAIWAPDGTSLAFVSEVFPQFSTKPFRESDSLNRKELDRIEHGPVRAKVMTQLLYREWNSWRDGKRRHIFLQPLEGGSPRDLTPWDRDAVPASQTFSAGVDYAFAPDGREIACTASPDPPREEAWRTNFDILIVPLDGGAPRRLTDNPAADGFPRYSSDGRYLAYRAQSRPGYEADRWQLMVVERATGTARSLTADIDHSVEAMTWSPDNAILYYTAEVKAGAPIFAVGVNGQGARRVFGNGTSSDLSVSPDGRTILFANTTMVRPVELFTVDTDGRNYRPVTRQNASLLAGLDIPPPEEIWFDGDGGERVHAWLFTPPGFNPAGKYPFIYLVHGGPQSAWMNAWSYRWNPALWAAQGYVVMAPNPRGSTGFGQAFVDGIRNDWGGKVFRDLMKGLDTAEDLPYVDRDRKAAAGASFGGYMMNWFQAKAGGRFRTLVTHCGTFDFYNAWGATEEIWFDEWERLGTPWENPEGYDRDSPNRYLANFSTPNLVIHNELDYRVPLSEGMQLFTALQRKGIPSKFLYFPDEGHWVLKPANSELWHRTVFAWLADYLHPQAPGGGR